MAYLASEPELDAGGWAIARAFQKLSTERQVGMGIGPIPIRAVWDWEDREGIYDPELRDFIETILMSVDALACKRLGAKNEEKSSAPPKGPNRPPPNNRRR